MYIDIADAFAMEFVTLDIAKDFLGFGNRSFR